MRTFRLDSWFTLPTLGRDTFRELMQSGVVYDKKFGFRITSETDLGRFVSILSSALANQVDVARSCYICEEALNSERREATMCENCVNLPDIFSIYLQKFSSELECLKH